MFLLKVLLLIKQLHVSATVLRHHQVVTLPTDACRRYDNGPLVFLTSVLKYFK
jgi:hypothetical protein